MRTIKQEILSTAKSIEIDVRELTTEEGNNLLNEVLSKYTQGKKSWPWWSHFSEAVGVLNRDSWKWIEDYVRNSTVILFFDPSEEKAIFEIKGGKNLVALLAETSDDEFYLTNIETDYILCFNHHDVMIACGKAMDWLRKFKIPEYDMYLQQEH